MYNIGKMKKSAKKKLLIISLVFTLCFSACGTDKVVETEAEKIVEAVTNKDMKAVETIILGKQISHRDTLHQSTNTHRQAAAKL